MASMDLVHSHPRFTRVLGANLLPPIAAQALLPIFQILNGIRPFESHSLCSFGLQALFSASTSQTMSVTTGSRGRFLSPADSEESDRGVVKVPRKNRNQKTIETWQAVTAAKVESSGAIGLIGSLFDGLLTSLQQVLRLLSSASCPIPHYQTLERSAAALLFWGNDHDVSGGELDERLQHSRLLRDTVLMILISIGELVSGGKPHRLTILTLLTAPGLLKTHSLLDFRANVLEVSDIGTLIDAAKFAPKDSDDSDAEEQADTHGQSGAEIYLALQAKIENLKTLSASLECPAESESDDEETRKGVILEDRPAHVFYADLVAAKFPRADRQLVQTIGKSNWERYKQLQRRLSGDRTKVETKGEEKAKSDFHDSGIGSAPSVIIKDAPQVEYAETVISKRAHASHKRLPTLPKEGREGEGFTCETCNELVKISRTKDWR